MSFHPLMMKLVVSLLDHLPANPTVVELGNQTFDPSISGTLSQPDDQIFPLILDYLDRRGRKYDRQTLAALTTVTPEEQKPHTATQSLIMDLNVEITSAYGFAEKYDLVTNNGTGEHLFNQYAVFKNMHDLARCGGLLLFVLPFYNWLNHGFFNFNPILFVDLAAANSYELVRLSLASPVGQEVLVQGVPAQQDEIRFSWQPDLPRLSLPEFQNRGSIKPWTVRNFVYWLVRTGVGGNPRSAMSRLAKVTEKLAERSPNINVAAVLRKTRDQPFVLPLQGMYADDNVESEELRARYAIRR
jgi:hypothetical protein